MGRTEGGTSVHGGKKQGRSPRGVGGRGQSVQTLKLNAAF